MGYSFTRDGQKHVLHVASIEQDNTQRHHDTLNSINCNKGCNDRQLDPHEQESFLKRQKIKRFSGCGSRHTSHRRAISAIGRRHAAEMAAALCLSRTARTLCKPAGMVAIRHAPENHRNPYRKSRSRDRPFIIYGFCSHGRPLKILPVQIARAASASTAGVHAGAQHASGPT